MPFPLMKCDAEDQEISSSAIHWQPDNQIITVSISNNKEIRITE